MQYILGYTNKVHSDLLLFINSTQPRSTTYSWTSLWRRYKDVKVVNLVSVQTAVQTGKKVDEHSNKTHGHQHLWS